MPTGDGDVEDDLSDSRNAVEYCSTLAWISLTDRAAKSAPPRKKALAVGAPRRRLKGSRVFMNAAFSPSFCYLEPYSAFHKSVTCKPERFRRLLNQIYS